MFSHTALEALYSAAEAVLENRAPSTALLQPLEELRRHAAFRASPHGRMLVEEARRYHDKYSEDVEIDDLPIIDPNNDGGYWIMAWCYVDEIAGVTELDLDNHSVQTGPFPHIVGDS